ncbi:MAG: hypothetical protein ABSE90_04490 [Verrucomicrobiota bacterium]
MNKELSSFAGRLRDGILSEGRVPRDPDLKIRDGDSWNSPLRKFDALALELFALQFENNAAYRKICRARGRTPQVVEHWTQIPAVPTEAFKELELSCIPPEERAAVFHSSGTTGQKPSRHFHNAESLAVYEASLWAWFETHLLWSADSLSASCKEGTRGQSVRAPLLILTPPPAQAPHSSLVHMFETVRRNLGGASIPASRAEFPGKLAADGSWILDLDATLAVIQRSGDSGERRNFPNARGAALCRDAATPQILLGTAFSFVYLLDYLVERDLRIGLPAGSRVMETGGYKNRSRSMPKSELHALLSERLGITPENIICEYGMSELSSQAYALGAPASRWRVSANAKELAGKMPALPGFHFPPWARVQIISPETGREVADGETGLIRVFDLANVFSVAAIQTEDFGIRRDEGFELIGRAQLAEPRGCSLMTA